MRRVWIALIVLAALTLVLAPTHETPALPEPGARRIVAAVLGGAR